MADLSVDLCGLELPNPFVLASGPLTWNAGAIQAAFAGGAAAVVTKTIRPEATINPVPHIADAGRGSLLNTEGWSDLTAEEWIERELPALRERHGGVLIASLGHTPQEVAEIVAPVAGAGPDLLELVSYRAEDAAPMVAVAKEKASLPVLIKVSANWPDLLDVVKACLQAGADGVTAIDSIGPTLRIDVETGQPLLGSFAWLSGRSILPISLRVVAQIAQEHGVPVVGTGGVAQAEDAVEMVMAGATAVGVHSTPLLQGLGWFEKTLARLDRWLEKQGHSRLADLRGLALPHLQVAMPHTPLAFTFDPDLCTRCGRCVTVCGYGARQLTDEIEMLVDEELCRSCGLCVTVCAPGALDTLETP
ncbi:MAG: 4Fe-4S binding protein [Anaerolineae bacterium]|nr:4Fe-4S binding protein [Anaerolineae bacterium]